MSDDSDKLWLYADVDSLVISLWPLVKAHNWTYRDLLNFIRPGLKRPNAYPCEREQDFSAYCVNVLGLRKQGKGVSAKNGKPAGHEIATRASIRSAPPVLPSESLRCSARFKVLTRSLPEYER